MACEIYKEIFINTCPSSFIIQGLTADTNYIWHIEDKFRHGYTGDVTSNGDGEIEIQVVLPLFPDMFNEFSGDYKLRFMTEDRTPVRLCDSYDYLLISFEIMKPQPTEPLKFNPCTP